MQFRLCTLTFKALNTGHPSYLTDLFNISLCTRHLLIGCLFHDMTYHLDLVLLTHQPYGSGTRCLTAFANHSHFETRLELAVRLSHPQRPTLHIPLFFNRLWRYMYLSRAYLPVKLFTC